MHPSDQQAPDVHALIEEADALNERGAYTEGLRTAERAIDLAGDDAAAWTTKGWSLENLERLLEAEEAYRTALRHDAGSPWAAVGLATVLDKTGRGDQAGDVYRTIAEPRARPGRGEHRPARDRRMVQLQGGAERGCRAAVPPLPPTRAGPDGRAVRPRLDHARRGARPGRPGAVPGRAGEPRRRAVPARARARRPGRPRTGRRNWSSSRTRQPRERSSEDSWRPHSGIGKGLRPTRR